MADIFTLFDGTIGAGGAAAVAGQSQGSFSQVTTENDAVSTLASGSDSVDLLVDYSDFSNFVTFNSAESYVTVTADQILNYYPFGGSADDLQVFLGALDGFQTFFLENWPSWRGHLRLNAASGSSYVSVNDFGVQDGAARTSFLSPGTGSISVQGWLDVPPLTDPVGSQVVLQKLGPDGVSGFTVFVSGSSICWQVASGSTSTTVTASFSQTPFFFAAVLDRTVTTGSMTLYTATTGNFPVPVSSGMIVTGARLDLQSGSFYIASGSMVGYTVHSFTGSIDSLSVWSYPRQLSDLTSSFNRQNFAQYGLLGAWEFNDASPDTDTGFGSIVHDSSGHRLDGRVQNYYTGIRGSGSFVDGPQQPILSLTDPDVINYVVTAQTSGSTYDAGNDSLIFNLFPDAFSPGNDPNSTQIFQNFALILARHFDRIKLYVNQLANLRRVNYGDFDQAPDELLPEVARYFGWSPQGSFSTADSLQYFTGRNVQLGPSVNVGLGTQMAEVKAALLRRVLLNLSYIYKTKGTAESVNALLRSYGVSADFIRLKEYAHRSEMRLSPDRVVAQKSVLMVRFDSGSITAVGGSGASVLRSIAVSPSPGVIFGT